ncbi:MAG: HEAT repeat domain-containing protein [Phycisphaerae bacterium]
MMSKCTFIGLLSLAATACLLDTTAAAPASDLEKQYLDKITEWIPGMSDPDIPKRKDPQQALEKLCHEAGAPGKTTEREALCRAMMAKVGPDVPKPARIWILRKVEPLGRDETVAKLTELLRDDDADIRETARRALVNNPSPQAGASLRAELARADTATWQIAIINGLAFRRDGQAVDAIATLTSSRDDTVARAAVCALGDIRTPEAIKAVTALLQKPRPTLHASIAEAAMKCAEELIAKGSADEAAAIYERLYDKSQPQTIRIAGLQGIAAARGTKALPMLFDVLNGEDARMRLVAARSIQDIPGDEVTQKLLAALGNAQPETAELIIDVLGQRGPEARQAIARLAREAKEPAVKDAAVLALAQLGDASAMDTLLLIAKSSENATHRSVALRGYVRLAREQGGPEERLQTLTAAMKLANNPDDSKFIVSAIGDIPSVKALDQLLSLVDGDLHAEAFAAAVSVSKRIAGRNQTAALDAADKLSRVAKTDSEKNVIDALRDVLTSYCTSWLVSGPYKQKGKEGLDTFEVVFPPEQPQGDVKEWKPLNITNPDQPGHFDLGKGNNCCAYVRTTVISESEREVQMAFGSDDAIKVWLNGQLIHANKVNRPCTCDEDKVKTTLKKGKNTLLIKVVQGGGDWAFCCAIRDENGKPLTGIQYKAE